MIVFDTEGNIHDKEPVDVRELVNECGWSLTAPGTVEKPVEEPTQPEVRRGRPPRG